MASTAVNRAKFIKSIIHFMSTYGFQGVDIDWEYPGARDRGGRPEDKGNFVILCREMQAAFAGRFGLTVTLPASFWYLQHFDVKAMEPYVSWFNVMTYDIHGVWDRDNRYTGPYVRPHTNLTQIDDALGLLWRAGVNAANVVMGLGYYGRSFTLADPTCTGPGCLFKEGGAKGDCTDSMGILSAAEIDRIITSNIGKRDVHGRDVIGVIHDTVAAVKIATFGGTQWVSFDDEDTFSAKKQLGTMLGLGGYMAWAIDQGMFGKTNAATHKDVKRELDKWGYRYEDYEDYSAESTAADTCYATFCGGSCAPGYSQWTQMSGEIGDLGQGTACKNGELQTLCCRTGATQGTCEWFGWRGFGLPCSSGNDGGCPEDYTLLTHNTASYVQVRGSYQGMRRGWSHSSLTCTGGTQSYCCKGFKPSQHKNDLKLLQPGMIDGSPSSLAKRDATSCAFIGAVVGASLVVFPPASLVTGFALLLAGVEASVFCFEAQSLTAATVMSGVAGPTTRGRKNKAASGQAYSPYMRPVKSKPKAAPGVAAQYGRYTKWDLDGKTTCSTSYMCEYGNGFDQVCDNQRWALDKIPNVGNVFHYVGGKYLPTSLTFLAYPIPFYLANPANPLFPIPRSRRRKKQATVARRTPRRLPRNRLDAPYVPRVRWLPSPLRNRRVPARLAQRVRTLRPASPPRARRQRERAPGPRLAGLAVRDLVAVLHPPPSPAAYYLGGPRQRAGPRRPPHRWRQPDHPQVRVGFYLGPPAVFCDLYPAGGP
jgi:hypothetical protein